MSGFASQARQAKFDESVEPGQPWAQLSNTSPAPGRAGITAGKAG